MLHLTPTWPWVGLRHDLRTPGGQPVGSVRVPFFAQPGSPGGAANSTRPIELLVEGRKFHLSFKRQGRFALFGGASYRLADSETQALVAEVTVTPTWRQLGPVIEMGADGRRYLLDPRQWLNGSHCTVRDEQGTSCGYVRREPRLLKPSALTVHIAGVGLPAQAMLCWLAGLARF